jgi:glycosyltransferase involved in cell wall biosynthesis
VKTRVLEVLATLRRAGAERIAVSLATRLDPARFETGVVSLYDAFPGGFDPVLAEHGVPVWRLGKRRGFDPRMWPRLARVLRSFRPDIVHTHSYVMRYALPACAFTRTGRIVHSVHNMAEREVDAFGRAVHRIAWRAGALAVAVSPEVARGFRAMYGFAPAAVIPNGADPHPAPGACAREAWRRAHGFSPADLLVVSVARFEPQKNPFNLIHAFAHAAPDMPAARLVMAGEGSLLEASRSLAASLGVADRVHFTGLCREVPELLAACDIFALGSDWEGTPLAVIEAMAARLPVVATAVGGVPELVEDGVTGLLASAGDPGALARALASLARQPARLAMGEAAARRALRFDSAAMVGAYAALFERIRGGAI